MTSINETHGSESKEKDKEIRYNLQHLFSMAKFSNLKNYLWEFFYYDEKLKFCGINKNTFVLGMEEFELKNLITFHKKLNSINVSLDEESEIAEIKNFLIKLDINELQKQNNLKIITLLRHLAFYIHKSIYKKNLNLFKVNNSSIMLSLIEFFPQFRLQDVIETVMISNLKLDSIFIQEIINNYLIKPLYYCESLQKLIINKVDLNENCLELLYNFMSHHSEDLTFLKLNYNKIGTSKWSMQILASARYVDDVDFSNNHFDKSCIQILLEEYFNGSVFFLNNKFNKEDINNIWELNRKTLVPSNFYISFADSPRYEISNIIALIYDKSASSAEYYDKYISDLQISYICPVLENYTDYDLQNLVRLSSSPLVEYLGFTFTENVSILLLLIPSISNINIKKIIFSGRRNNPFTNLVENIIQKIQESPNIKEIYFNDLIISDSIFLEILKLLEKNFLEKLTFQNAQEIDFYKFTTLTYNLKYNSCLRGLCITNCKSITKEFKNFMMLRLKNHKSLVEIHIESF